MRQHLAALFAILVVPFVAVWGVTQGPRIVDTIAPVYEITSVGAVKLQDSTMTFDGVAWAKHHDCHADGVMYVAADISTDGGRPAEVLFPAERTPGVPYVPRNIIPTGGTMIGPTITVTASPAALAQITSVRLVVPCERPWVGHTHARTNPLAISTR